MTHKCRAANLLCTACMAHLLITAVTVRCTADTMTYEFYAPDSEFVLRGGFAGFDDTYAVRGSLELEVDFGTRVASIINVDATLNNTSAFRHGASLDSLLNLTGSTGTVLDSTRLAFSSVDNQGFPVSLDVGLTPESLTLVGENAPDCCGRFS